MIAAGWIMLSGKAGSFCKKAMAQFWANYLQDDFSQVTSGKAGGLKDLNRSKRLEELRRS